MAEDPKYTIKKIVDNITLKKDNESDAAAIIFLYKGGPETMKELFDDYDVVVTFGDAPATGVRHEQEVPTHHPETYPVYVSTVDKYVSDSLVCTADKMQHKMKEQMRSVIEAAAISTGFRLRVTSEDPITKWAGGLKIWETTYSVLYTDT